MFTGVIKLCPCSLIYQLGRLIEVTFPSQRVLDNWNKISSLQNRDLDQNIADRKVFKKDL